MRILIFFAVIIALGAFFSAGKSSHNAQDLSAIKDPVELAKAIIDSERANVSGDMRGPHLIVTFSMNPWLLTGGTGELAYRMKAIEIVKREFVQFPQLDDVTIKGTAKFKNIRGNESEGLASVVKFIRKNASSINWDHFDSSNLFKVADQSYRHPAFDK
jgi:hypothetical protein